MFSDKQLIKKQLSETYIIEIIVWKPGGSPSPPGSYGHDYKYLA